MATQSADRNTGTMDPVDLHDGYLLPPSGHETKDWTKMNTFVSFYRNMWTFTLLFMPKIIIYFERLKQI